MASIYVTSGDAYLAARRLVVTVTDDDGATVDISTTALTFMVKRKRTDDDSAALITKVTPTEIEVATPQTGATKGKAYIELEEADTDDLDGKYLWELEADDAIGKVTLAAGGFYVTADLVEG